jgi:hypothetical protein
MKVVKVLDDGKRAVLDTKEDACLYDSPHNPPNTGTDYTRGTDLYFHVSKGGRKVFYSYHWSMWQGEESSISLLSEQEAMEFLEEKAGLAGWGSISDEEMKKIKELTGIDLLEETA